MDKGAQNLRESIASIEVAMLTTINEKDAPVSRPMYTLRMSEDGELWFFAGRDSHKMDELEENNKVNVSYSDSSSHTYVSITGSAVCIEDENLKNRFWNDIHETWFPKGVDDPNLCLLRVRIATAEIWDRNTATMLSVWK